MSDFAIRRWTGAFGLATVALWLAQFPLYMAGPAPSVYDGGGYGAHLRAISTIAFTRILLDQGVYISMMVFAAGLRHLVQLARADYEWLGTLLFGTALVWLAVTLVADGLAGGAVLDAISAHPDPSVTRALILGGLLIYNGSTAFVMTALFLATAGVATLGTSLLPAWTGWLALIGAGLCLLFVPVMFAGPVDYERMYNVGGFVPAMIANFPPALWFVAASITLLFGRAGPAGAGSDAWSKARAS